MYKLAYISIANAYYHDKKNIQALVEVASYHNQTHQLTSSLVYSEGHFFHLIEGEKSAVNEAFSRISNDKNHRVLQLITEQEQDEDRLFPDWPLAFSTLGRVAKFSKPENHFLNFSKVFKNRQLRTYNQIHEAFFTPLKNSADDFYQNKLIIISDSHVKVATFMNWIADTVKSKINRVEFDDLNASHHLIDYLDFKYDDKPLRILGFEAGALADPAIIPQLISANNILLLVSANKTSLPDMMQQMSRRHLEAIRQCPGIECFFSESMPNQIELFKSTFSTLDIPVKFSDLQSNNFAEMWGGMRKSMQKNITNIKARPVEGKEKVSGDQAMTQTVTLTETKSAAEVKHVSEIEVKADKDITNLDSTSSTIEIQNNTGVKTMANIKDSLAELMKIDGAMGCFIADYNSGMLLAKDGGGINLDLAAAGNTEVIRAKMKVMAMLGIKDTIEDILVTLGTQFHIIRPSTVKPGLFLYIVLDKSKSNLALSRFKLAEVEKALMF